MKVEIPDALKAAAPSTWWGKVLLATPVVMTVIATMLAGLSSSEMNRAQYARSFAAQLQAKAGDQWSFFQAKRLRAALQRNTLDLLQSTQPTRELDAAALAAAGVDAATIAALTEAKLPALSTVGSVGPDLAAAIAAVEQRSEPPKSFYRIAESELAAAIHSAIDRARKFDEDTAPINQAIERLERDRPAGLDERALVAARLRYHAARYDMEARLNQAVANLYELQVALSNHKAERHRQRSLYFFYGMATAQAAVIIATFSLAAQRRSWLWGLAAAAGAAAVIFALYVYLSI